MLCFFCTTITAQKNIKMDFTDPNENFYVTQKKFNNYYKHFEKELARERREEAESSSKGKSPLLNSKSGREEEQELGGYELFKRWENFMAPRVYPSGDKTLASKAFEEYQNFIQQSASQKGSGNSVMSATWQAIGPFGDPSGSNAGRINAVRFDPVSPTGFWAGAPDGGLWKTTNTGSTWSTNTDYLTAIGCSDVVFDPSNPMNMWMASGDSDAGDSYSIGVLKSTDGGVTWVATGLAWTVNQGRLIRKMVINPLNKNTIIAATNVGLYRTINGGTSWAVVSAGNYYDVEYKPTDTTTVYACSTSFYKSTNGGATFATIAGVPNGTANNRLAIAVTPANPAYVYVAASASSNSGFLGFYQSTNSGTSFTQIATATNLLGWASAGNDVGGQGWYTLSIAASPTNPNEVCVGGVNIWRTTNAGTSWGLFAHWTGSGAPYVHADIHDLIYKNGTTIYAGCDGGVFQTTNSGASWFSMNGNMNIAEIYKIGNSASTYSRAITGHQDDGTNLFTGGWAGTLGGDGMDCFIDRTNDNVMYGEQYNGSFNRTLNGGASWAAITTGMTGSGAWVTPWHQDPVVANTLYGGRQQMFKSTNQGTNWAQIGTLGGASSIVEFAVAPSNTQIIYVIQGNTLYKTTNGGGTWTNVTGTLPTGSAQMTSVIVEEVDPNSVWVSFSGYSAGNKVYQSLNGGTTWTNYSTGLPNLPTNRIVYNNGTKDAMYAGCDVGVYYRDSTMANWVIYNNGLPNVSVRDLAIYYPLGKLRAATFGRGVYEADLYNTGTMAPIANFTADKQFVCPGMTVNFTDLSTFGPTSWAWTFQGGTPATSTLQNPSIVYNTPGTYSVQLIATNGNGSSTMTQTLYITVSGPNVLPLVEGFSGATFPPTNWQNYDAGNNTLIWSKSATVGKPAASLMFDNYNLDVSNTRDEFRAPKMTFAGYTNVKMYFDVAYARYDATYSDSLAVLVSTDCGVTYTQLYLKGGTTLATAPDKTVSIFAPTAVQWRTDTVFLNAYSGMGNVMVSFQNRGHYGQALYIDNVNIAGTVASMPPTAAFTYTAGSMCTGQTINFTDASTNAPTSWSWQFPGGVPATSTSSNPAVSYATSGVKTVTLISTNLIGPSAPVTQTFVINATPAVSASTASTNICSGSSVLLTGSGATTYSWSTGALTNTTSVSPAVNTTYTVTGTTTGCSNSSVVSVTVNATPTVAVNSATVCTGTSTNLTASGATTYSWNTGATTAVISVTPASTTVYTVTGTTTGCANAKTTTVTVVAPPTVAVNNATVCSGSPTSLTASGALTYSWSTGALTNTISISPLVTTVYTVTGTSGGCTNVKTSTVTAIALPTVTANNATVCAGSNANLTAAGATSYSWNTGALTAGIVVNPTVTTTYTVTGTTGGCSTSATAVVNTNALPAVISNTSAICGGGSATLTASGATTYTWNTGATTAAIVVAPPVTTTYTIAGTNALGCSNSSTTSVFVGTSPTVAVNSSSVCSGNSTNLTASGATSYSWSTGALTAGISVSPASTTVYTVTGYIGGCTNVKTSTVTVSATPTVIVNNASICVGNSATLTASGATTYSWNTGATTNAITVNPIVTTTYTITGTTGACSGINTTTVTVNVTPTVAVNSSTICSGNSANITASGAATYSWNTGATTAGISVSPSSTTIYTVTGYNGSCIDVQTSTVLVNISPTVSVNSATICTGQTTTLTATGAPTFSWNTGATTSNIVVTPTVTTTYTVDGTGANGCVNTNFATVTVNLCTGVAAITQAETDVNVYPNPSNGIFIVEIPAGKAVYNIEVRNALSQIIYTEKIQAGGSITQKTVNLTDKSKGIYTVSIWLGNNRMLKKIVVE